MSLVDLACMSDGLTEVCAACSAPRASNLLCRCVFWLVGATTTTQGRRACWFRFTDFLMLW